MILYNIVRNCMHTRWFKIFLITSIQNNKENIINTYINENSTYMHEINS